jgi:dipeptidyl aminopeptidase/acylaminoacyl peptidase
VVDFFGPTDFVNWGDSNKQPVNDPKLAMFMPAFGLKPEWTKDKVDSYARDISPIYKVTENFPPILIIHGDKDRLVPLQQSNLLDAALEKSHVKHKLLVIPGGGHDAKTYLSGMPTAIEWFATYLKG